MRRRLSLFWRVHSQAFQLAIIVFSLSGSLLLLGVQNAKIDRDLEQTAVILEQLRDGSARATDAVADVKADNARQTRIIECLLLIQGGPEELTRQSQQECQQRVDEEDTSNNDSGPLDSQNTESRLMQPSTPTQPRQQTQQDGPVEQPLQPDDQVETQCTVPPQDDEPLIGCLFGVCI